MNKRSPGRPPKPPGEVKSKIFTARCTPEEYADHVQLKKQHDAKREQGEKK